MGWFRYSTKRRRNRMTGFMSYQSRRIHSTLLVHRVAHNHMARRWQATGQATEAAPQQESAESQRQAELEHDLQMARDIQQGLLLAAVPYLRGWELSAVSTPARELGGDLYDFLPLSDGWHAIMIGDVSGKGLPAALRMAVARTVFRHEARIGEAPASTMAAVNRGVCSDIPQGMVTMLYSMLDPRHGTLRIANAGHTYPLLLNGRVEELELPGMPLGVDPDIDYEETTVTLQPGDSVVLYTDGVTEASNVDDVMFGEKLEEVLAANITLKPRALMGLLLRELRTWGAGRSQDDDITLVILRRRFVNLSDELRSIGDDVLGVEQAAAFWSAHVEPLVDGGVSDLAPDAWTALLPALTKEARSSFNRGLARELSQQLRLAIEEYREGDKE
jgi:sigma-B regulation protein RsbU (phosphoserine phosphatase)